MTFKNYLDLFFFKLVKFVILSVINSGQSIRSKLFKKYSQIFNYFRLRCKNDKL